MERKKKAHKGSLGFGTAAIGRPQYINIKNDDDSIMSLKSFKEKGLKLLDEAYYNGIRYFDTAPGYGMAEELIASWIVEKCEPDIEVATKWGYTYVANFDPSATIHEVKEHSLSKLNEQWAQSKPMLPFLSTYQIHSATLETGVLKNSKVLNRLAELKEQYGLLIGITTTGANQGEVLKEAMDVEVEGQTLFDAFQVTYNIFDQSLRNIANMSSSYSKRIIIKEALANGRIFSNNSYPNYSKSYSLLEKMSLKYDVGVDAIALRFCMDTIDAYQVLSGASFSTHLQGNIKTLSFELDSGDIELLKGLAVSPYKYWEERKLLGWN
ncbi:MAG: aryl-alcohol dehydrogenase-like predicted oxidoreductase [Saprospiraceae bacterium]|jgi:aryl-alcohol dehydrogenase-like predicted oxidoreductase